MSDTAIPSSYARPQLGLKPHRFSMNIPIFPDVTFTIQEATIPSVTLGVASYDNPLQDIHLPGEKLTYTPLPIRMMVEETLDSYIQLYGWMRREAFPDNQPDLASQAMAQARLPANVDPSMPMSDLYLMILDSNNNPTVKFTFRGGFPIFLGDLKFDTTEDGTSYIYVDVEFAYTYFTIDKP